MADKEKYVDVQEIVEKHYDQIKNGTYEWDDDELRAFYKLVTKCAGNLKFRNAEEKEDFIQTQTNKVIMRILPKYDKEKDIKVSTYVTRSLINGYLKDTTDRDYRLWEKVHSLDVPLKHSKSKEDSETEWVDMFKSSQPTVYEQYILDKWQKFLFDEYNKTLALKECVINGVKRNELAQKLGVSKTMVTEYLNYERYLIIMRAKNNNIPVPEKYKQEYEDTLEEIKNKTSDKVKDVEQYYMKKMKVVAKRFERLSNNTAGKTSLKTASNMEK